MKNILLLLGLFLGYLFTCSAQIPDLERVEPSSWWVGMKNQQLQLLIHGNRIAGRDVQLMKYNGVKLVKVNKVENPNYLFVDLRIDESAQPGTFTINLAGKNDNSKNITINYTLKQRDRSPLRAQGITNKDLIYLLMPDRFANGDPANDRIAGMRDETLNRDSIYYRHGGDIQGVIDHLDYLKELGITAVWMTPEIENDQPEASYHGYAATDFYKIDPRYGTNELYKVYVDSCHAKGLKVIKDIVHNHCGSEHWIVKDLPMKDWVHPWPEFTQTSFRDQPAMDPYASTIDKKLQTDGWFVRSMPDMNEENPFVQTYLIQNHIWWIEYAGIDGLRLDTYPYNNLSFMAKWKEAITSEYPHISIFGETFVHSIVSQAFYSGGGTLNGNFDTKLPGVTDMQLKDAIYEALNGKFGWTTGVLKLYDILSQDFLYKDPANNVVFLDNHDMSRFFSMVGEDMNKYKSGLAILLTMRGIPEIYYGTEILMKNFSDPDGWVRLDFKGGWKEDKENKFASSGRTAKENEAFDYLKTLANYRKNNEVLQTGKLMHYVPENGTYVYFRFNDDKTVMVATNTNDTLSTLATKRFSERIGDFTAATDIISGEKIPISNTLQIPARTTLVLELNR